MTETKKKKSTSAANSETKKPTSARLLKNRPADPEEPAGQSLPPNQAFAQAISQVPAENVEPAKQKELLAPPEAAAKPSAVQNGRMLATYVGLGLERDKDGEKFVHLDFSFPLESAMHDGLIPAKAKDAWYYLQTSGDLAVKINGIPAVTLDVYLDPKERKPELHLVAAEFSKAIVQIVEETGKGAAKKVARFAFRLLVERDKAVMNWAGWNDGNLVWLTMVPTQGSLTE